MPPARSTRRHAPAARIPLPPGTAESIVLTLFDLANHLQRRGERIAAVAGLTTQQWLVLLQIAGDPNFPGGAGAAGVLASDIARTRAVTRATVSAVVTALRRRGLIREDADPADRRRRRLVLTPAGASALAAIQPARRAANDRLLADLGARDRERFLRDLRRCYDALLDVHEDEQLAVARERLTRRTRRQG